MHIIETNRIRVTEGGLTYWRPDLPALLDRPNGWGQASSVLERRGKVLLWALATDAEMETVVAHPGVVYRRRVLSDAEAARKVSVFRGTNAPPSGIPERNDFVNSYRFEAEKVEAAEMGPTSRGSSTASPRSAPPPTQRTRPARPE